MDAALEDISRFLASDPGEAFALILLVTAAITGAADLTLRLVVRRLERRHAASASLLRAVATGAHRPLRLCLYILAVGAAASLGTKFLPAALPLAALLEQGVEAALLAAVAWMGKRIADETRDDFKRKRARTDGGYDDFSALEAIHVAVLAGIYVLAGIVLLGILGVPPTALAGLGVAGGLGAYALTMANQILISNIFAGLVLYFDRPFGPGDWIITENGAIEGTVVRIGLRLTVINGFDQRPIYVPNSIFNSTATINASRMRNRRIKQFVGVRYEDFERLPGILADIRTYLGEHPEIDPERVTLVNLVDGNTSMGSTTEGCFGSSSINFQVYTFTRVTNWVRFQAIQDEVMLRIGQIILDHGAEIAFPTTTLDTPATLRVEHPSPAPAPRAS